MALDVVGDLAVGRLAVLLLDDMIRDVPALAEPVAQRGRQLRVDQ